MKLLVRFLGVFVHIAVCGSIVGLVVAGCSTLQSPDPARPGERLPNTADIAPLGDQTFSVAPDGAWILYPAQGGTLFDPRYMLYATQTGDKQQTRASPGARSLFASSRGPIQQAGCWSADSRQVFLPGDRLLFVLDVARPDPQWTVRTDVSAAELQHYRTCPRALPDAAAAVQVQQRSPTEAVLVDARNPARMLARHRAQGRGVTRLTISDLVLSHDATWLAYTITESRGSFVAPSLAYVLDLTVTPPTDPQLLATHIFGPLQWEESRNVVYGIVRSNGSSLSMYRWEVLHAGQDMALWAPLLYPTLWARPCAGARRRRPRRCNRR